MKSYKINILLATILAISITQCTQSQQSYVRENYDKKEYIIEMRDGVKLFTAVYSPKDKSKEYPILLIRTPYSVAPYGEDKFAGFLGASIEFAKEGFIFVLQDVRGRYMSEGEFDNMRPHNPNKKTKNDIDESSYTCKHWRVRKIITNV